MKKNTFFLFFLVTFLFLLFSFTPVAAQEELFAPEEIIVKFSGAASVGQINKINQKFQAQIKEKLELAGVFTLKVPKGLEEKLAQTFASLPFVEFAEPNFIVYAQFVPNDSYFSNQWGLNKIKGPEAWDLATGSSTVKIAILDTGIDNDNPDLSAKVVTGANFTTASDDDLYGHGTHVAGIAAAVTNNSLGVAGIGFNTSLMSVKVLGDAGSGSSSWVADGIKWAADNGAKVINLSLGSYKYSSLLLEAINYAWGKDVIVVAAAGNDGRKNEFYPCAYKNVICVAATDENDKKAYFSNYGVRWVDVAAPGVNIFSTLPNHSNQIGVKDYGYLDGTSMATPFVSGLAGLIFGQDPTLNNSQVRSRIEETSDKINGTGTYWVKGRINAYQAVLGIAPQISLTPTPTISAEPTLTPTPLPVSTNTPTPVPPTPTNTPTPKPPTPTPGWCRYFPNLCR